MKDVFKKIMLSRVQFFIRFCDFLWFKIILSNMFHGKLGKILYWCHWEGSGHS